jgi:all-trans-retinol 13,14-reductase
MDAQHYDVIVIGSGIGGLTCASILVQIGKKKVLVIERHSKAGGFTHTFKRETKYEWDVGLHYVGQMQKGLPVRAIFDLITAGQVKWNRMPDPYDVFIYPGFRFGTRSGRLNLEHDLITRFPQEERAIKKYFNDLHRMSGWTSRFVLARTLPDWLHFISHMITARGSGLTAQTMGMYLQRNIRDPQLRALLMSQWGTYGLPPASGSLVAHAAIVNHYMDGGYYPAGGSKTIADSIVPVIEQGGGRVLLNHQVTGIMIQDNRAIGVTAVKRKSDDSSEQIFLAPQVVSDAGARITYGQLLPGSYQHPFVTEVRNYPGSVANVTLYVGFKEDPRRILPVRGENYWIYDGYDHDDLYARRNELLKGEARIAFLSFPSLKRGEAQSHTAEIMSFVDYEWFKRWADQPLKKRDQEYQQLKEKISQALLGLIEKHIAGFREQVAYYELSTPLSTEYYTGFPEGNIYGIPATPSRYKQKWISVRTPLKGLYLTGADSIGHGIVGALMGGVLTAATIIGLPWSMIKIFRTAFKYSKNLRDELN